MAPQVPAIPRSESKARFFVRLGLDARLALHRHLYTLMKSEAIEGRRRIIASLMRSPHGAPTTQQAVRARANVAQYSTSGLDESMLNAEAARILRDAQPATRILYSLAYDPANPSEPNWIIRWMLWHVFRYRDGRQNGRASRADSHSPGDDSDDESRGSNNVAAPGMSGSYSFDEARISTDQPEQARFSQAPEVLGPGITMRSAISGCQSGIPPAHDQATNFKHIAATQAANLTASTRHMTSKIQSYEQWAADLRSTLKATDGRFPCDSAST